MVNLVVGQFSFTIDYVHIVINIMVPFYMYMYNNCIGKYLLNIYVHGLLILYVSLECIKITNNTHFFDENVRKESLNAFIT